MNLQDGVLNQIRKENAEIRIVLLDGSEFRGRVRGFDNFTVAVEDDRTHRLVYKHAIAQIIHPKVASPGRQPRGPRDESADAPAADSGESIPNGAESEQPAQAQQPREPRGDRGGDRGRDRNRERRVQERRNEPRGGGATSASPEAGHKPTFNPLDLSKLKLENEAQS